MEAIIVKRQYTRDLIFRGLIHPPSLPGIVGINYTAFLIGRNTSLLLYTAHTPPIHRLRNLYTAFVANNLYNSIHSRYLQFVYKPLIKLSHFCYIILHMIRI